MPIKPLAGLTRPLRVLLIACVAVSALAVAADLYSYAEYSALPANAVIADQFLASDAVRGLVAFLQFGLLVACTVVFLMWAYRANKNLRALAGVAMRFTPGWTVWWFFIPIASLFKPYQAVKEIWHVSHGTTDDGHAAVKWWWFLFLLSNLVGSAIFQLSADVQDTASFLVSTGAYAVADTIDVLGYAVTLIMVLRVAVAYAARIDETAAVVAWAGRRRRSGAQRRRGVDGGRDGASAGRLAPGSSPPTSAALVGRRGVEQIRRRRGGVVRRPALTPGAILAARCSISPGSPPRPISGSSPNPNSSFSATRSASTFSSV